MPIEKSLERIADALEALLKGQISDAAHAEEMHAAGGDDENPAAKEKKKDKKPPKTVPSNKQAEEPAGDGPTKAEVRAVLKKYGADNSPADARQILADHGAKSMTDLEPERYQDVIDACAE
jgi:hypothetical protein